MSQDNSLRDGMIHNARESRRADETKILQKVNLVNRQAFTQRLPGALEHTMRLVMERLQNCLAKDSDTRLNTPSTWLATPAEIESLAQALWHLEQVRQAWPAPPEV
jgi:hypothetical protein